MAAEQINITLGTAGHIDHGKTALVKCLTGCDTDRLKAEKERGMSIDLGYAPCRLADRQVGIVDVPGHENFIKTMVAGASGMDAVILVVAADDGVMPQTREHLDILTLLGLRHGLVVLSKVDRVDGDQVALAEEEVRDLVAGTFLDGAPVIPLSSVTGEGFDRFLECLGELLERVEPKPVDGVFRVPVDRAFSVKGYGTVVAGVPVSGSARVGDGVVLLPQGSAGRIRGIEVYGRASDTVRAGQCAALNVSHWDHQGIRRGDTLAQPGYFEPCLWHACWLRLLPRAGRVLKNGARVKIHTGTAEVAAAVYSLHGDAMEPGQEMMIQLRAQGPLVAGPGDRYILRSLSPVETIGGGIVLEPLPRRLKRNRPGLIEGLQSRLEALADPARLVVDCLDRASALALPAAELARQAKIPQPVVRRLLEERLQPSGQVALLAPGLFVHPGRLAEAERQVRDRIGQYHARRPESLGMPRESLRADCPWEKPVLDGVLARLRDAGVIEDRRGRLALCGHQATFRNEDAEHLQRIESLFRDHPFRPPGIDEAAAKAGTSSSDAARLVQLLLEHGKLVQVADGLFFHRDAVDQARQILTDFIRREGSLESVRFKYLLDTSRKYAIPLLDYFDGAGVTRRVGNTRYLR